MLNTARTKNKYPFWPVLLLALLFSWFLYQFVKASTVSLDMFPPSKPKIIARADWGARALNLYAPQEAGIFNSQNNPEGVLFYASDLRVALNTIVVHHSAFSHASPAEIQGLHMDRRGFADIAYHFLIDSEGVIYEGRQLNVRGAHVQGFNTGSVGVVLLGNFNEEQPTQAQFESLADLVDYLRYTHGLRYLAGHKDYPGQSPDGTDCPGYHLYPLLPDLARELGMWYGVGGYVKPDWIE
jgi:hypothetical protein